MKRPTQGCILEFGNRGTLSPRYGRSIWDPTINRHIWNQYDNQLDIYMALPPAKLLPTLDILDVSCATRHLAMIMADVATGGLVSRNAGGRLLEYATSRYPYGNIEFMSCERAREWNSTVDVDLIYCNQIIEHLCLSRKACRPAQVACEAARPKCGYDPNWHHAA